MESLKNGKFEFEIIFCNLKKFSNIYLFFTRRERVEKELYWGGLLNSMFKVIQLQHEYQAF